MKRLVIFTLAGLVLLFATDLLVARKQSGEMDTRVGSADFLAALTTRVKPGMTRASVEKTLAGFRELEESKENGEVLVGYGYWFGLLPPFSRSGLKYVGEIIVKYSSDGKVIDSSYWYN